jgi:uncharacterized protein YcbK (DUF882 family)
MTYIKNYFDAAETSCRCGCGLTGIDEELLDIINVLRHVMEQPLYLNSARRCKLHNKREGGAPKSGHLFGKAVDISLVGISIEDRKLLLTLIRRNSRIRGIGIGKHFFHIDILDGARCEWGY